MSIKDDATTVLIRLAQLQLTHPTFRDEYIDGPDLDKLLQLGPERLSDAVALLEENGYLEVVKTFGTAPYDFNAVMLTSRGRFEMERLEEAAAALTDMSEQIQAPTDGPSQSADQLKASVTRFAQPVGSPYGFTVADWETVSLDHEDASRLIVVFGHQSDSKHFDSARLRASVEAQFQRALTAVLPIIKRHVALDFRPLAAGYGGHLFNQIARDIIASDIAVFETTDLNPNVMIEMGVALTWGTRVLPIRRSDALTPPSDISGQTWAAYEADGSIWTDPEHDRRLAKMVEMACKRKPRRG